MGVAGNEALLSELRAQLGGAFTTEVTRCPSAVSIPRRVAARVSRRPSPAPFDRAAQHRWSRDRRWLRHAGLFTHLSRSQPSYEAPHLHLPTLRRDHRGGYGR